MQPEPVMHRRHEADLVDQAGPPVVAAKIFTLTEQIRGDIGQTMEPSAPLLASEVVGVETIGARKIVPRIERLRGAVSHEGAKGPRRTLGRKGHSHQIVEIGETEKRPIELSGELRFAD